ncbi:MAG TPA: hypothetical protein PKA06_00950 [Gemmatales bacterium]|nr:hypothetical protein [Gemmatales bacterium]HMP15503.1 hypothetical protein [Gemmatales bacterium]
MARCEQGYLCDVCGGDVEEITQSELYLRYVLGEVTPEVLTHTKERHIRCNPALAQFIVDHEFTPVVCETLFDKRLLDHEFVRSEEQRVTEAWRRLQWLPSSGLAVTEYPLDKVRAAWNGPSMGQNQCEVSPFAE